MQGESKVRQETSKWLRETWRPLFAFSYIAICLFDFIVFPVLWSLAQAYYDGNIQTSWQPITLLSGGLFHIAAGAVCGVTAWQRGSEKIEEIKNKAGVQ